METGRYLYHTLNRLANGPRPSLALQYFPVKSCVLFTTAFTLWHSSIFPSHLLFPPKMSLGNLPHESNTAKKENGKYIN